ncbi:MAG: hypothetical protein KTR24_13735 [Saprospiraceae bacterium]|nr:hypothetical protein [Saprospiraceae bacterium]
MNVLNPILVKQYLAVRKRDWRNSPQVFLAAQKQMLDHLLLQSRTHVPFQAKRINDRLSYTEIPPVGKRDMMESLADTFNRKILTSLKVSPKEVTDFARHHDGKKSAWLKGSIKLSRTSGTTGRPGTFCRTEAESWRGRAISLARIRTRKYPLLDLFPKRTRTRWAIIGSGEGTTLDGVSRGNNFAQNHFNHKFDIRHFSLELFDRKMAEAIDDFKPFGISAFPLHLLRFAEMKLSGIGPTFEPPVLASGADLLEHRHYKVLRKAFPKALIQNHYGSIECSPIANSCPLGNLHLNNDLVVCEAVDAYDQEVPLGTWSDALLVTDLRKRLQPIIRYRISDSIRILPENCACGRAQPILEIRGRRFAPLYFDDDSGRELSVSSEQLTDPIINDFSLPRSHVEYHHRNHFKYFFHLPKYRREGIISDPELVKERALNHLRAFTKTNNCHNSVRFEVHVIPEDDRFREGSKFKAIRATVKAQNPADQA